MTCGCIAAHTFPGHTKPEAGKTPLRAEARAVYIVHDHTAPMLYRNFHIIPGKNPGHRFWFFMLLYIYYAN